MSRREIVVVSIALLVALVGTARDRMALAATATRQDPHPLPADTLQVRMAEAGTYGGRFVLAETSAPSTFNAVVANDAATSEMVTSFFGALVGFDHLTQRFTPALVKSWETSPDGLTWTLHLRRGARFSDGHPITSADVLFSFEVCYDAKLHPSNQDLLKVGGKPFAVTAPDPQTVVIRVPDRYAMALQAIGSVNVLPKHVLEASFREGRFAASYGTSTRPESLVSSGPFVLKKYVPNEMLVLGPNPYWYGVDARGHRLPYLDELVFLIIPDLNTESLQFDSGVLDALGFVGGRDYQHFKENQSKGDYTFYDLGPMLASQYLVFNLNRVRAPKTGKQVGEPYVGSEKYSWFNSPVFRRAVSHAIDRDAMIRSVFFGEAVKNWSPTTPADKTWYTPDVVGADYDPTESRRLLASLGLRDGDGDGFLDDASGKPVSFVLKSPSDNPVLMQECTFIQDDLAKVGIRCIPSGVAFMTMIGNLRNDFQYEALLLGIRGGVPPDPGMNQNILKSSGPLHAWNILQPAPETPAEAVIDSLLAVNVAATDMATRKSTWSEMQEIINRECFMVWLPTPRLKVPIRNRFGNVQPTALPPQVFWNVDRIFVKGAGSSPGGR